MKPSIVDYPKFYLGDNVGKLLYINGSYALNISSDSYVQEAIKNVKKRLK